MRKLLVGIMCIMVVALGCGCNTTAEKNTIPEKSKTAENTKNEASTQESVTKSVAVETINESGMKRMVVFDRKLYVDTGEIGISPTCGTMDFSFDKTTDKKPVKNGQTNFGKGYKGQYYIRDNRIIIMIDNEPHVFAYQENDLKNVGMSVTRVSERTIEINFKNFSDAEWQYDNKYEVEWFNEQSGIWEPVNTIKTTSVKNKMPGMLEVGKTTNLTIEWEWLNQTFKKGTYRIIKTLKTPSYMSVVHGEHTCMAGFVIE